MRATFAVHLILTCTLVAVAGCDRGSQPVARETTAIAATPSAPAPRDRRIIVFAGTSLTAGLGLDPDSAYPSLLQRRIDSAGLDFEAINAGVSGETTAGLLQRLDWLLRGTFDVFVIESGANDGLRGVSVEAIEANLREIIRRVREARPGAKIMLVQMEALPNYGRSYGTAFHDLYVRVARDMNVVLLPFLLDGVAGRAELNQGDGIHPNDAGAEKVAATLWGAMQPELRALDPAVQTP
ncbi:MAG TPA: arylesterase [Gemmatimonadaceae bacterium]|nr:arylesterase [Gemmatimonadaceae bacterium]